MYDEIRPLFERFRAVRVHLKEYPGKTSPSEESPHPEIYLLRSLWNFYLNCLIFGRKYQVHELIRRDVDFYQFCDLTRIYVLNFLATFCIKNVKKPSLSEGLLFIKLSNFPRTC